MPDWEEDSSKLYENLLQAGKEARDSALRKDPPRLELVRTWHQVILNDLEVRASAEFDVPPAAWIGRSRGEDGLEDAHIRVGNLAGVPPAEVGVALDRFIAKLRAAVSLIDETLQEGRVETPEHLRLVLRAAAWTHAEWIRIHPFGNGNGRTARLWANWVLMRFGLPPFVRLRPRPEGDAYGKAGLEAMKGNWRPTLQAFEEMIP